MAIGVRHTRVPRIAITRSLGVVSSLDTTTPWWLVHNQFTPNSDFNAERAYSTSERLADFLGFGRRAMATQRLQSMDDHLLRDIGVSRDEIASATGLHRHE